ncbi:MAG: hypothetical protein IJR84_10655 [Bacteroidaceae bacterium]|nr:hypothetical protein [Bacteroidaceae bacterium]
MTFIDKLKSVLEVLGLTKKYEEKSLSNEEFMQLCVEYQKKYLSTLKEDLDADERARQQSEETQQMLNSLYAVAINANPNFSQNVDEEPGNATLETVVEAINNMGAEMREMASRAANDNPAQVATSSPISINGFGNTPKFLFGVEHPMFDMKQRWNILAANPRQWKAMPEADEETGKQFRKEARVYSRSLAQRYAYLHANNLLGDIKALGSGTYSTNYEGVETAGVGDQFIILRQDALIARVLQVRDLTQFFPVRYGVQDRDLLFNTFFGELSQGYQEGEVYKGGMKIENEMGYVDDAMIKLKFGPMKELERMYIAYLNKEGSDPIKWTMIEYCILHELETAQVEQNKRRMRGIYVKPEAGVAGSYLNAGTGIIYTLLRYVHDYSIKPHDDAAYRSYTSSTMLDAVQEFCSDVVSSLSEDMDLDKHVLYLNKLHQPWWIKNVRTKYGKDIDFKGPEGYLNVVPDTNIHIKWLPYLGQMKLMLFDIPGNLQFIEYIPGEMLSIKMEEQMEMVRAWSTWKEGCGAAFTGRKFTTKEDMDANAYDWQQIFMNLPVADIAADAVKVNANDGFWQLTGVNTQATAITDIENAKAGVAYCIEIGDDTYPSSIAKSGKFANLTEAWTPTAVGDYILVILRSDGKFVDLERRVGGVRTINRTLQPNVPGGR